MTVAQTAEMDAPSPVTTVIAAPEAMPVHSRAVANRWRRRDNLLLAFGWVAVTILLTFYGMRLYRIGNDVRHGFWVYWQNNHYFGDAENAIRQGEMVLRNAQSLPDSDPAVAAAVMSPGPGLFDGPLNPRAVLERWHRLSPVYHQIYRGWVQTYDELSQAPVGEPDMDYPPMRLMVMTLWTWKLQTENPGISSIPRDVETIDDPITHRPKRVTSEILRPMLRLNAAFDGVSTVTMFLLVWVWTERRPRLRSQLRIFFPIKWRPRWLYSNDPQPLALPSDWRSRWGDPWLVAPAILLTVLWHYWPKLGFEFTDVKPGDSPIDARVISIGWWSLNLLRVIAAISLARFLPRPFRGPACGAIAATMVWLNPPAILDSVGWPQWDVWLPCFFLVGTLLVSIDCWIAAGIVLGIGCMFKGQLMFTVPVFIFCPLMAGWFGRLARILGGLTLGASIVIWPWMINNPTAQAYIVAAVFAAVLASVLALFRKRVFIGAKKLGAGSYRYLQRIRLGDAPEISVNPSPTWPVARILSYTAFFIAIAVVITLIALPHRHPGVGLKHWTLWFSAAVLLVPFLNPRRFSVGYLVAVYAAAFWCSAITFNGRWSWWYAGFVNGTQKHQVMQLGSQSLSNLSSLLDKHYNWDLHSSVGKVIVPSVKDPIEMDLQTATAVAFFLLLIPCAAAASIHLRRRDPKFLMAMTAPWVLFVTLLTQLAARYTIYPALIAASLIAISVSSALWAVLLTALACIMFGNQMMERSMEIAPITYSVTRQTHPDLGFTMLAISAMFIISALTPSRRPTRLADALDD